MKEKSNIDPLLEITRIYDNNPRLYIEENLYIKNQEGETILMEFNEPQRMVDEVVMRQISEGKPVRVIVLKGRKEGISTLAEGYGFERVARHKNMNGFVIAHEPTSTFELFEMNKLFYDMLPEGERPMKKYDNKAQLTFENPDELTKRVDPGLRSKIRIATADKVKIGRGLTLQYFHGSEVAYWRKAKELMLAVMNAMPNLSNTMAILESTANGIAGHGKYFYDKVMDAYNGIGDFELVFIPWFKLSYYTRPFVRESEKEELERTKTDYEKWLVEKFNLTLEQLNWRRWAIINKADGDEDQFKQEYPATIEESFIASSNSVFPKALIDIQSRYKREPLRIDDNSVEIYEEPIKGHYYVMGLDSSEGEGGDEGAFEILDALTGREVAAYSSNRCPPERLGDIGVDYAIKYNNAIMNPEINNPGTTMIKAIKDRNYPNLYRREVIDKISHKKTKKIGWRTTGASKKLLVSDFKKALRGEEIGLSSKKTIGQMITFVYSEESEFGMGAEVGSFDDRLMAAMLAWAGLSMLPQLT